MGSCRLATRSKQASTAAYFTSYQVPLKYEQLIILKLKLEKREPLRFQRPHSCRVVETLLPTTSKLLYCLIVYVLVDSKTYPEHPKKHHTHTHSDTSTKVGLMVGVIIAVLLLVIIIIVSLRYRGRERTRTGITTNDEGVFEY